MYIVHDNVMVYAMYTVPSNVMVYVMYTVAGNAMVYSMCTVPGNVMVYAMYTVAGPFFTKPNLLQITVRLKSYICAIVCMCTRDVHLEAVSDLSSQALLAALRRFISRRGCPSNIYSDDKKNFTVLANQLKALFDILKSTPVQEYVSSQFIPPYFPHFEEIWEAAVKQTKNRLLRACRAAVLNFEELSTLL
ncbi:hypothetical protein AVEN_211903-1 [Araneus ventricosus]|uniref:Integrase catalytic domain-containing protein n=1 Tax=Araneus ventricosus TaxID=182803 RepID=A0A4Y2JHN0_ARAVE|nr:hypothetical protein AVEN_211903-1 [Araneus ventricosus]